MGDLLGRVFAIILASLFMFIVPIMVISQKQDTVTQNYVDNRVMEFVDTARTTGKISPREYERFCHDIDKTGVIFEVNIYHSSSYMDLSDYTFPYNSDRPNLVETSDPDPANPGHNLYRELVKLKAVYNKQQILEYMYPAYPDDNRDYYMKNGDYIKVEVSNITPTLARKMTRAFFKTGDTSSIYSSYSGLIGNSKQ